MAEVNGAAESVMINRAEPRAAPTCVWMNAGLLTYKLCDRGLDCEQCPLDAALRGTRRPMAFETTASAELGCRAVTFPGDRLYSTGHTWLKALDEGDGRIRFGIDGFAASFMPSPARVRLTAPHRLLHPGEKLCEIEFDASAMSLAIPLYAQVARQNRVLEDDPTALVTAPYGKGWIAELMPAAEDELDGLLVADAAREQARLDSRRFRRLLALHLLADDDQPGGKLSEEVRLLTDLRQVLGEPSYLAMFQELVR